MKTEAEIKEAINALEDVRKNVFNRKNRLSIDDLGGLEKIASAMSAAVHSITTLEWLLGIDNIKTSVLEATINMGIQMMNGEKEDK